MIILGNKLDSDGIRKFTVKMIGQHSPMECLSLGTSLIVTVIAHVKGNDVAASFVTKYNELLSETLGVDVKEETRQ